MPKQRHTLFKEWSPGIHYAKLQTLPPGILEKRRLYDFELLYVCQGEAATTMEGKRYALRSGDLIFLSPGVAHQNEVISSPEAQFLGIHFDFFGESHVMTEQDLVVNENEVLPHKFALEAVTDPFAPLSKNPVYKPSVACVHLMEQLVHEFSMRPAGYELVCKALMLSILSHLLRSQAARQLEHISLHGLRIKEIMSRIEAQPSEAWSNRALAQQLNINEDYMAKLFKQIAGLPPGEYVRSIRHREARRLLRETEHSIEHIGQLVGYPDLHYFSRIFRQQEGIPPRAYRKLSRIL